MKTEVVLLLHCVCACVIFGAHQDVAAGSRLPSTSRFQNEVAGVVPDSDAVISSSDTVDDVLDATDRLKRTMGMLRMGRSQQQLGEDTDAEDQFIDDKRTMGMLRMGKRTMGMLRMGRGGAENFEAGNYEGRQQPAADAAADKRTMGMLRMGRSDKVDKKTMSMLRMG